MKRALVLLLLLAPLPAIAQQGFQISPGLTLAQAYDDDLGPAGTGALFTDLTPVVTLGYGTQRWALLSHGALDVEAPDTSPFHTMPWLRGTADATLTALLTDRLTLTAGGSFWDTNTPRDLNLSTGFDPGQVQANSESADSALAYRFTGLFRASLEAGFVSTQEAGLTTDEASLTAIAHRQFSAYNGGRFDLQLHRFEFVHQFGTDVEAPMVGWDHHVGPDLSFDLLAGPRFDGVSIEGLEGNASLTWLGDRVHVTAALASTQTAIAGFVGLVDTESASTRIVVHPADKLFLTATPAVYISSGAPIHAQVVELRLDAFRQLTDWLALIASYRLTVENARLASATPEVNQGSVHNQVIIGLTFALPSPGLPTVWPTADTWKNPVNETGSPEVWREPSAPTPSGALAPQAPIDQVDPNGPPPSPQIAPPLERETQPELQPAPAP